MDCRRRKSSVAALRKGSIASMRRLSRVFRKKSTIGLLTLDSNIAEVRSQVLAKVEAHPELYDEIDVNTLRESEWFVKRFLLDSEGHVLDAVNNLNHSMIWRKDFGINRIKPTDFPKEFFETGFISVGKNSDDTPIIYIRYRLYKKIPEWSDHFHRFVAYLVNTLDKQVNQKQLSLVVDTTGGTLRSVDISLTTFAFGLFMSQYAFGSKFIMIYEPPWLLKPLISSIVRMFPDKYRKIVKVCTKNSSLDYIDKSYYPTFMGGPQKTGLDVPDKCPSLEEVAETEGLPNPHQAAEKFRNHYNSVKCML